VFVRSARLTTPANLCIPALGDHLPWNENGADARRNRPSRSRATNPGLRHARMSHTAMAMTGPPWRDEDSEDITGGIGARTYPNEQDRVDDNERDKGTNQMA